MFKLKIVNGVLAKADAILVDRYKPLDGFCGFDEDSLPTNSDVTMILALYMEQIERFRSDHIGYVDYEWRYVVNGHPSEITSRPPTLAGGK